MMKKRNNTQFGVIIISTFPDEESAVKVAKESIVNKKLCACVNLTKVRSLYDWKNNLEDHEEFLALFKTTDSTANELKSYIKEVHPYDIPEIVELKMNDVSKNYLSWIVESTTRTNNHKNKN
jgi:periplasmic divalent cation tolerance protein